MQEDLFYYSDCLKISARLYVPDGLAPGERRPAVVCVHGNSGRRDVYMPAFARYLIAHGYVALIFYHRGFGDSEGVRTRNIPMEQVSDIVNAVTFMQQRPEVDPARVGLFGVSFGGATVTYAAAIDERVRCVVEVAGPANGERWTRSKRPTWEMLRLMDELKEDRIRRVMTGQSKRLPYQVLFPQGPGITQRQADAYAEGQRYEGQYPEGYPLESVDAAMTFRPEDVVHRISPRAALFVHTERDTMVPVEEGRTLHAKAGEPKKLVIIPGMDHKEVYQEINAEVFEVVMKETVDWYRQYL
ncbi:MAG: alpha/beta hydrolase [bacterium]|nr:alpha/beta fold hydrolase [Betaproteobacteria bacterium]